MARLDGAGNLRVCAQWRAARVQKRFDLFGVLVLVLRRRVVGGMIRDVLIGAVPPVAIANCTISQSRSAPDC